MPGRIQAMNANDFDGLAPIAMPREGHYRYIPASIGIRPHSSLVRPSTTQQRPNRSTRHILTVLLHQNIIPALFFCGRPTTDHDDDDDGLD